MPSYMGDYEPRFVIIKVPSMWKSVRNEGDTTNLHALMSAPITCTLPLIDVLKIQPDLWESIAKCLTDRGFRNKQISLEEAKKPGTLVLSTNTKIQVPINKVGDQAKKDEGNTTLSMLINKIESIRSRSGNSHQTSTRSLGKTSHSTHKNEFTI